MQRQSDKVVPLDSWRIYIFKLSSYLISFYHNDYLLVHVEYPFQYPKKLEHFRAKINQAIETFEDRPITASDLSKNFK